MHFLQLMFFQSLPEWVTSHCRTPQRNHGRISCLWRPHRQLWSSLGHGAGDGRSSHGHRTGVGRRRWAESRGFSPSQLAQGGAQGGCWFPSCQAWERLLVAGLRFEKRVLRSTLLTNRRSQGVQVPPKGSHARVVPGGRPLWAGLSWCNSGRPQGTSLIWIHGRSKARSRFRSWPSLRALRALSLERQAKILDVALQSLKVSADPILILQQQGLLLLQHTSLALHMVQIIQDPSFSCGGKMKLMTP